MAKPIRDNYIKTLEVVEDVAALTGIDKTAVQAVLKVTSAVLAHYLTEICLDEDNAVSTCDLEVPYIGKLSLNFTDKKSLSGKIEYDIELTYTFYKYLIDAHVNKISPLEDLATKKFVDVFLDKYSSII